MSDRGTLSLSILIGAFPRPFTTMVTTSILGAIEPVGKGFAQYRGRERAIRIPCARGPAERLAVREVASAALDRLVATEPLEAGRGRSFTTKPLENELSSGEGQISAPLKSGQS